MLNIFNLFLFLFAIWAVFIFISGHISLVYALCGIIAAALATLASIRLRLFEKKTEMLYLSFGFYRHFCRIFLKNFFSSINLIIDLALRKTEPKPTIHYLKIDKDDPNAPLLAPTLNMTCGLFCVALEEDKIMVHAIEEKYFRNFDLKKNLRSLSNVNDDNLV